MRLFLAALILTAMFALSCACIVANRRFKAGNDPRRDGEQGDGGASHGGIDA